LVTGYLQETLRGSVLLLNTSGWLAAYSTVSQNTRIESMMNTDTAKVKGHGLKALFPSH